jgi:hypothetical protein
MRRWSLIATTVLLGSATWANAQAGVELVGPTQQIPRGSFKTWSLFLICNPDWATPDKSKDLATLYGRFRPFHEAIGPDNLGVWFWKRPMPVSDPNLGGNIDIARSAAFCAEIGKPPSQGPYLVITTDYPDLANFPKDRAIFELGSLPPADLAKLLNNLTDQLLLQNRVNAALIAANPGGPTPEPPSLWIRLLESARQTLIGFGCAVKLQISTGVLTAELRGCAG